MRTLQPQVEADLHETKIIMAIDCYNDFEQSPILYNAAWKVFRSLPPLELLQNFNQQSYDEWYASRFTDTADGWHSGPDLLKSDHDSFILVTPTSSRLIFVEFLDGKLWTCKIQFPGGSVNAACLVMEDVLTHSAIPHPVLQIMLSQASITGFNEHGKFRAGISDVKIMHIDGEYDTYSYQIK